MPVTSYYSVGGEILGEETGGTRLDYLTDALGSVTGTVTHAGVVENTYRYKPYGEQLSKTGTGSDPKFLWCGKWGYRNSDASYKYIRTRIYSTRNGTWNSHDTNKELIDQNQYVYVDQSPVSFVDPEGMQANRQNPQSPKRDLGDKVRVTCYGDCWMWGWKDWRNDKNYNCRDEMPPFDPTLGSGNAVIIPGGGLIPGGRCGCKTERWPHDGDCAIKNEGRPKYPIGSILDIYDCSTGQKIKTCQVCDTGGLPGPGAELDMYIPGMDRDCTKTWVDKKYCIKPRIPKHK